MLYIDERCRSCGKSVSGVGPDYRAIGMPVIQCPHCGAVNKRSARVNEWELIPEEAKISLIFLSWFWNTGYVLLAYLFLSDVIRSQVPWWAATVENSPWILFGGIGLAGSMIACLRMRAQIKASRHRMSHPAYRKALKEIGIF